MRHNGEHESDEQSSSPVRSTGRKRVRRGSKTPTNDGQVPQYIPKVKSCVACRQQKIKCDVVREPFEPCSHCKRMREECKIDLNFKRVAKRDQLEHLYQQIRDLKQQLELAKKAPSALPDTPQDDPSPASTSKPRGQTLEDISLSGEDVTSLFDTFFKCYHQYCPILNPGLESNFYFEVSPILGWTVILVAARRYTPDGQLLSTLIAPYHKLLWATISKMPQKYYTVKALALLCTWPIPSTAEIASRNSTKKVGNGLSRLGLCELDPTSMLSGIMMQIAIQTGLHRSSQTQEFIQQGIITQAEVGDRHLTWAVCNIVSQNVDIIYGKPPRSIYDWALAPISPPPHHSTFTDIEGRLKIEKFCDKMTQSLYSNSSDPSGMITHDHLPTVLNSLNTDLEDLDALSVEFSPINKTSLLAVKVHFTAFVFFISGFSPIHTASISAAYNAAIAFIQAVLDPNMHSTSLLHYCSNYILRTLISASCILLKILNSSIAVHLDAMQGRTMFNACILALRSVSLKKNDFPDRVAEAHTRMWRAAGGGFDAQANALRLHTRDNADPLELRIRSRMCVSHVYDCVWSWKRTITAQQADETPSATVRPESTQLPPQETRLFQVQLDMMSQMEDFDLFNSFDWSFDETVPLIWP